MTKAITPDEIEAAFSAAIVPSRTLCGVGALIEQYPALGPKIMDVEHFSAATIARVLKSLDVGAHPSTEIILRHRRGACRCPEGTS